MIQLLKWKKGLIKVVDNDWSIKEKEVADTGK